MGRSWDIREVDAHQAESLSRELGLSPLMARLLLLRDVQTVEQARDFLQPGLRQLHDPFSMHGMEAAVERLVEALKKGERICVYGDYDVDGVTATALLILFFNRSGLDVQYRIPSRLEEGYGLNMPAVEEIASNGTHLLVTVDCGISDLEPIQRAVELGMDVIVMDHHQVPAELPSACAVLDPHQSVCSFPTKDLAAVGVAFNLLIALRSRLRASGFYRECDEPNLREYLDIVALGTVADIVPLVGENRVLAHCGLAELTAGRRPGVAALKEVAGLMGGQVTTGHIAFRLAPRINAGGRLGRADKGVELITTRSFSRALILARELDEANTRRQSIERQIFDQARENAPEAFDRHGKEALVLACEGWHVGVVGIVASRLVELFDCPVVLIALDGERGRGSARTTKGVHLFDALRQCGDMLEAFGGHEMAAGLTIRRSELEAFRKAFREAVLQQATESGGQVLYADAEVQPNAWHTEDIEALGKLEPHGAGNPEPVFLARDLQIKNVRIVGRDPPYHLKAVALDGSRPWDLIGFRMGDRAGQVLERMDLLYTPEMNSWEGYHTIQLRLKDLRPPWRS
ncbi:MAG: single-stranded-DNA-specific exonuclease RecJ [Deltaproteobacteria bacterium]|nr:single-stranded-DNA-specific exonuclease RecJ [Deltaproteobacteria bacterium]